MPVDHFPSTHATWIDAQLTIAEGCRAQGDSVGERAAIGSLRGYLMQRYHAPLIAYVAASSLRRVAEPEEIVAGFLADRACRPGFLPSWRASGLPLRRWMMTGINLYGKSIIRERSRNRLQSANDCVEDGNATTPEPIAPNSHETDAERAFERAWARTVLEDAVGRVHAELDAMGRLDDFEIFRRRVIQGVPYERIAADTGCTISRCSQASRSVLDRLRAMLRSTLRDDGIAMADLDAAISDVYRSFGIERRSR